MLAGSHSGRRRVVGMSTATATGCRKPFRTSSASTGRGSRDEPASGMYENEPPCIGSSSSRGNRGCARNASTHAARGLSRERSRSDAAPAATNSTGHDQYEMHGVDALACSSSTSRAVEPDDPARRSTSSAIIGEEIDLEKIPLDDTNFELLASGETTGLPARSAGMRRYIRELRPDLFTSRPWWRSIPVRWTHPAYIRRNTARRGSPIPSLLEPYLNRTYGVFVYQETSFRVTPRRLRPEADISATPFARRSRS